MKRFFLFFFLSMLLGGLFSCSKENNKEKTTLVGSKWGNTEYAITFIFITETDMHIRVAHIDETTGDVVIEETDASYTYVDGSGAITIFDVIGDPILSFPFVVDNNTMTLTESILLTKNVDGGLTPSQNWYSW